MAPPYRSLAKGQKSMLRRRTSVADPGFAPEIDRVPGAHPFLAGLTLLHRLELGRYLDIVAVGIPDHEEEVVARAVSPRSPPDRNLQRGEVIRPELEIIPARGFVRVVVGKGLRRAEDGEGMVQLVGAKEAHVHVGRVALGILYHGVRHHEAERRGIELHHVRETGGGHDHVLEPPGKVRRLGAADWRARPRTRAEHDESIIRIAHREGTGAEQRGR